MNQNSATILIVDDNPNNLRVLEGILQAAGYSVRAALNGETALRAASTSPPILILLDIRMPAMDGFEVCRQLKQRPDTRDIPVIFISALQEVDDKLHAFQAGGVDYIVKPFQAEEVLTRARTHIELAQSRKALAESNILLEQLVAERTQALSDSNARLEQAMREEHTLRELLSLSHNQFAAQDYPQQALMVIAEQMRWLPPGVHIALMLIASQKESDELEIFSTRLRDNLPEISRIVCHYTDGHEFCRESGNSVDDFNQMFTASDSAGLCSYPLMSGAQVLGQLFVQFVDKRAMPKHLGELAQQMANVIGMGLARRRDDERLAWQAYHDELTSLPNRRQLEEEIVREIHTSQGRHSLFGLLLVDLDHFKFLNEAMGHSAGDQLLLEVARRLQHNIRAGDMLFRWGGDEFVVLLPGIAIEEAIAIEHARTTAGKLSAALGEAMHLGEQEVHLQASIGIAFYPSDGETPEDLLKHLDLAMHKAKEAGRNAIHFFHPDMQNEAQRRVQIEKELRTAIAGQQFQLFYQPQVDNAGRIIGAESLIRWFHPERGMVPPVQFIPLAEETGLILPIGTWVLEAACRQLQAWNSHPDTARLFLAVNVSARQFHQPDFVDTVRKTLELSGANPKTLELEVTESLLLADIDSAIEKMDALRQMGIRFSVDDFGTGYSSLAYLKRLPLDQLKVDQSFVRNVHEDSRNAAIVRTIISLARNLGMKTLAEGVEVEAELAFLKSAECDHYQGYYYGKPMAIEDFAKALPSR